MTPPQIEKARDEARRFLARVDELRDAMVEAKTFNPDECRTQAAAVKRASLDLTRALAAMRKRG